MGKKSWNALAFVITVVAAGAAWICQNKAEQIEFHESMEQRLNDYTESFIEKKEKEE